VTVLTAGAWRIELDCDDDSSEVNLVNVSAGNDSHFESGFFGDDQDFDVGEADFIVNNTSTGEDFDRTTYSAQGSNGAVAHGMAALSEDPDDSFDVADCVASATLEGF
jgi:hypothetical protein